VASAPDRGLSGQILNRATFMGALRVNGKDFLGGILENQNPLAAHRDDDKMLLLQFRQFLA